MAASIGDSHVATWSATEAPTQTPAAEPTRVAGAIRGRISAHARALVRRSRLTTYIGTATWLAASIRKQAMTTLERALPTGAPGAGSAMTAVERTRPHTSTRGRVRTCPRTVFRETRHASEAIICRPPSPGVRRTGCPALASQRPLEPRLLTACSFALL